ncbi:CDP-glucose 4,6-dehydratase [Streptomyces sp. AGS-58]|uniref:CDP-glucose 4,6-dehydratase n=1 Tax=unclassified Streptomyces TaxID=2593676 RepID=UPI0035A2AC3D
MADPDLNARSRTFADTWQGRRVLVTGYSGFVGSWLTTALLQLGADVIGFSADEDACTRARAADLTALGAKGVVGDVRDIEALHGVMAAHSFDVVFHLAAQPLVSKGLTDPQLTFSTNIGGSVNVLEAARRCGPSALVHVTSDKCYRNREWPWPYREVDELGGGCPYSVSKAGAELVFESYAELFRAAGNPTRAASVRFGNIIGGGDQAANRLVPDLVAALTAGRPVRLRRPAAIRPWQHVLDVVQGLLLLADALVDGSVAPGEVFNFAPPGDGASVQELAQALMTAWADSGRAPTEVINEPVAHLPEDELLRLDGRKAAAALGWRHQFDLERSAAEIVAWQLRVLQGADPHEATAHQTQAFLGTTGPTPHDERQADSDS